MNQEFIHYIHLFLKVPSSLNTAVAFWNPKTLGIHPTLQKLPSKKSCKFKWVSLFLRNNSCAQWSFIYMDRLFNIEGNSDKILSLSVQVNAKTLVQWAIPRQWITIHKGTQCKVTQEIGIVSSYSHSDLLFLTSLYTVSLYVWLVFWLWSDCDEVICMSIHLFTKGICD